MFSQRHYIWLARFCVNANLPMRHRAALCDELEREGPRFNRDKFERACGLAEYNAGVAALQHSATS